MKKFKGILNHNSKTAVLASAKEIKAAKEMMEFIESFDYRRGGWMSMDLVDIWFDTLIDKAIALIRNHSGESINDITGKSTGVIYTEDVIKILNSVRLTNK